MDKSIEGMARHLCLSWKNIYDSCEQCSEKLCCVYFNMAEELYNAGYRKIPDGAVVLTREEYDKLKYENEVYLMEGRKVCQMEVETRHELEKLKKDFDYNLVQERRTIRKETAEKFALKLADYFVEHCGGKLSISLTLQEFYKMIDEIGKELTEDDL